MAKEKERKFLLPADADLTTALPLNAVRQRITQVYLSPLQTDIRFDPALPQVDVIHRQTGERSTISLESPQNQAVLAELRAFGLLDAQGHLKHNPANRQDPEIRVRAINGDEGVLTIKRKTHAADTRDEFEFSIPYAMAVSLQKAHIAEGTQPIVKTRFSWDRGGPHYDLDRYEDKNAGLLVLEVENPPATVEQDVKALFPGAMPVADKRYGNRQLAEHPYSEWGPQYTGVPNAPGGFTK